jgi:hypothetical protein
MFAARRLVQVGKAFNLSYPLVVIDFQERTATKNALVFDLKGTDSPPMVQRLLRRCVQQAPVPKAGFRVDE